MAVDVRAAGPGPGCRCGMDNLKDGLFVGNGAAVPDSGPCEVGACVDADVGIDAGVLFCDMVRNLLKAGIYSSSLL